MDKEQVQPKDAGSRVMWAEMLANNSYSARNLIPFVRVVGKGFSDQWFEESIKVLFEKHATKISGMARGRFIGSYGDSGKISYSLAPQELSVELVELFGKPIVRLLDLWCAYCSGKTFDELVTDGFEVLLIEPDSTGTRAMDAWLFRGVHPREWVLPSAGRDLAGTPPGSNLISLSLNGLCEVSSEVLAEAQRCINKVRSDR